MVSRVTPTVPIGDTEPAGAAVQHSHWRNGVNLSSALAHAESFLSGAGFDRAPWVVVGLSSGIAAWFVLPTAWQWLGWVSALSAMCLLGLALLRRDGRFPYLRQAIVVMSAVAGAGTLLVWGKSALVGMPPISRPTVTWIEGRVISRQEQPAQRRVRLILATREPESGRAIKVRLNLDIDSDRIELAPGAVLRLRARMVPPASPMLPGGYDFARTAWFSGLAATGSVLGEVTVLSRGNTGSALQRIQQQLSRHVRANLGGSPGTIAAAFASGDRGAIAKADEDAMRDAGLTHLLSISGLHVSAVIAAAYLLTLRLLGLLPWLVLRVRLPLVAAASGALAGIGYTLLTGSEVPTIRSCVGAVLVLIALALGREALSMRMVAVGAAAILLAWPEALVGPSFQMSFAAVTAIVALHGAARIQTLFQVREEPWYFKMSRHIGSLLLTGVVIELALLPIGLFHFHRAGVYGALANVVAIPLTTFVSMPMIALALLFDSVGIGAPFWWLAGKSLELLLALAHWTASWPGAVTLLPAMGRGAFALFMFGALWLALWRGRARLWGLVPALVGTMLLANSEAPDVLVSSDGRHVGITGEGTELLVLRDSRSDFAKDNLTELAGMSGEVRLLADWPGASCNADFCSVNLRRGGRTWQLLIGRGKDMVDERALAAACDRVDIVIAGRYLPRSCAPRWVKVDRRMLDQTGGLALSLRDGTVSTVAQDQGQHGWWNPAARSFVTRFKPSDQDLAPLPSGAATRY
ncbi:ComEC/Rec2 family competence protein [Novosphingobium sp.]|uniref:ComEC/Rec2 family competence protein n=1 Tax=Novosphingobium sp. TaxID=1874826 RepID=UPI0025CF07D7|nr:ComEC/Rec2 family competence protein [Novosphingobium sp.]